MVDARDRNELRQDVAGLLDEYFWKHHDDSGHHDGQPAALTSSHCKAHTVTAMASRALRQWNTARRARLEELYAAHVAVGGTGRGRRTATEQINWAIAHRLASEFQGYVRDLHDEASETLVGRAQFATAAHESVFGNLLSFNRQLDSKNATPSTLRQDFWRFGFNVLDEIKSNYVRGEGWLKTLDQLNMARNGIAHSDPAKIVQVTAGSRLGIRQVRGWDVAVQSLATALDKVTARKVAAITNGGRPW